MRDDTGFVPEAPPTQPAALCKVANLVGHSFEGGTLIATPYGRRRIEDLRIGDVVYSRDERTAETHIERVTDLLRHTGANGKIRPTVQSQQPSSSSLLAVRNPPTETLGVTSAHPFHVPSRGWVMAKDLRPGDQIDSRNGSLVVIGTVFDSEPREVYNLTIASDATYFVSLLDVWVHNGREKWDPMRPDPNATGPHSTFRRGPEGWIDHWQDWIPNLCDPGGFPFLPGDRFRRRGKPHGGVPTPVIVRPDGSGVSAGLPDIPWPLK